MTAVDGALGLVVAVVWGLAFVATRVALDVFSPPELTALRFIIAAIPAVAIARPRVPWSGLVAIGLTLFAGQFLFQFSGIASGTPPGLASLVVQTQAFFTVLFAALALGERPTRRQSLGMAIALAGVLLIALTIGGDLTLVGFLLTLVAAVSWGIGNVLLKRVGPVGMLPLVVWLSLVPPLPSLALALVLDGASALPRAIAHAPWSALGAVLYLGVVATIGAYALWGRLLARYPAAHVAPFALLVPVVGAASSALAFGERFPPLRLAGMALVLAGVAIVVVTRSRARRATASRASRLA